jgi:hypothetical protein
MSRAGCKCKTSPSGRCKSCAARDRWQNPEYRGFHLARLSKERTRRGGVDLAWKPDLNRIYSRLRKLRAKGFQIKRHSPKRLGGFFEVPVPKWVPEELRQVYKSMTHARGEFRAASEVRKLKRQIEAST